MMVMVVVVVVCVFVLDVFRNAVTLCGGLVGASRLGLLTLSLLLLVELSLLLGGGVLVLLVLRHQVVHVGLSL